MLCHGGLLRITLEARKKGKPIRGKKRLHMMSDIIEKPI